MILSYLPRLVILSLALFFFVDVLLSAAVSMVARRLRATKVTANLVLCLRMLPAALALLTVAGLCVPSYLELEPEATLERVGWISVLAALLGGCLWCFSICRAGRAIIRSSAWARHCERVGVATTLAGENLPVWVIADPSPVFALIGVLRPRLVISQCVLDALSPLQLAAVLAHEHGHRMAKDNLKRLLILLAPGRSRLLDEIWKKHTEWAADDSAGERLCLAEALVRVARIGAMGSAPVLVSSLMACEQDLAARVERLLEAPAEVATRRVPIKELAIVAIATLPLAAAALYAALPAVHDVLEYVIR